MLVSGNCNIFTCFSYTVSCTYKVTYRKMELDNILAVLAAFLIATPAIALGFKHLFAKGSSFELNLQIKTKRPDSE